MIIINKNTVIISDDSIEIQLSDILNNLYMLMEEHGIDITDYICNEDFIEAIGDLEKTIKIM